MYNEQSITSLETRIGWEKSLDTDFAIELDEEVLTAASERKVNSFHQLVTVENVYAAVPKTDMEAVDFNGFLLSVRKQAVSEVLTKILDQNDQYVEETDYSDLILERPKLFDDAIGYCIVIKMLELFVSSNRSNLLERNAKLSFQNLKIELEGLRNDGGFYVATGVKFEYKKAIADTQKILFPKNATIQNGKPW
jgi:hypothetical protein